MASPTSLKSTCPVLTLENISRVWHPEKKEQKYRPKTTVQNSLFIVVKV